MAKNLRRFIMGIYKINIVLFYLAGNPTRFAPRPNPAPVRAAEAYTGGIIFKSRTKKTTPAVTASVRTSLVGSECFAIKTAAIATARPSIRARITL